MNVLGIESSCDETAVAIVADGHRVLSALVASSADLQALYGGVVPEIAARKHLETISPLFQASLEASGLEAKDIDLVAVSQGPGLVGALLVGTSFARGLAAGLGCAVVGVNHVHAHVHGALLGLEHAADVFPAYAYVISGGHSNLYYMSSPTAFALKAFTVDDACGECFDKVAKKLGLGYPGGPLIEKAALNGNPDAFLMPKMVADRRKRVFSYSGLKTRVALKVDELRRQDNLSPSVLADLAASFQREAFRQLVDKLATVIYEDQLPARSLLVAGGVAANQTFRAMLKDKIKLSLLFPSLKYCSDNAATIAAYGWHEYNRQVQESSTQKLWDVFSRYPFEQHLVR